MIHYERNTFFPIVNNNIIFLIKDNIGILILALFFFIISFSINNCYGRVMRKVNCNMFRSQPAAFLDFPFCDILEKV